jgi:hypothetical protein
MMEFVDSSKFHAQIEGLKHNFEGRIQICIKKMQEEVG